LLLQKKVLKLELIDEIRTLADVIYEIPNGIR
jgi:hypothetical protein